MMVQRQIFVLLLLAVIGLSGCEKEQDFSQPDNPSTQEEVTGNVGFESMATETAQVKQDFFSYNPVGRRNPFKPLIEGTPQLDKIVVPVPQPEILSGPLQEYETNQYKLVGIVGGQGGNYAMVESPDGRTYNFKVGTRIGRREGVVQQITNTEVVITEVIYFESGKTERIQTTFSLNKTNE